MDPIFKRILELHLSLRAPLAPFDDPHEQALADEYEAFRKEFWRKDAEEERQRQRIVAVSKAMTAKPSGKEDA